MNDKRCHSVGCTINRFELDLSGSSVELGERLVLEAFIWVVCVTHVRSPETYLYIKLKLGLAYFLQLVRLNYYW